MMEVKCYHNKQNIFYLCLILLFIFSSVLLMQRHEPWRDETRPWIYARDYPMLDYILTRQFYGSSYPLEMTHIVPSLLFNLGLPFASYALTNVLVMFFALTLLVFYAPFSKLQKFLFIFSYYLFYEYNIIARSWSYGILFFFCLAVLYKNRFKRPILYNLFLFLFALSHIYTFIFAAILAAVYYYELFQNVFREKKESFTKTHGICLLLLFSGFFYIFYPTINPQNVPAEFSAWNTEISIHHLGAVPTAVIDAYLPVPKLQINFWQSRGISRALYGLPLFLLTMLFFIRKPTLLLLYLALCSSLFAVLFVRTICAFRHHGLLFIIFIYCLWVAKEYQESNFTIKWHVNTKVLNAILVVLLSIQVIAAGIASYYDWTYDFSSAERAASFLKKGGYLTDQSFIASYPSVEMSSILVRTPEYPKFYYLEYGEFRSFMVTSEETYRFNDRPHPLTEISETIKQATENKGYTTILLILDRPIESNEEGAEQYKLLAGFEENAINTPIMIYEYY